ncbi:hypothetical protein DFP72DRAFT_628825 [Ephemerocybe angulata]|uniref:Uncharacterized protein n=1 Tax=Ephemerocybe angulata TaxID=980116 RepID=A0A8H6MDB7_9AGAR|nr:hypothetical protein DFP72DRAFT_628825 [Tulosesus angulatus]
MDSSQRRHRRAVSTPKNVPSTMIQSTSGTSSSSTRHASTSSAPDHPRHQRTSASRIMNSVKRSLTPSSSKHRSYDRTSSRSGVYSTPEERMPPQHRQPAHFMTSDERLAGFAPPTIEQIAMGLHVSRTPHLRPLGQGRHRGTDSVPMLPPPPARSSMKKQTSQSSPPHQHSDSVSSDSNNPLKGPFAGSSTTVTSVTTTPSSARSSGAWSSFSKFRMGRFLGSGSRSSSAPSSSILSTPVSSPRHSTSEFDQAQKKAVRFEEDD